jgi:hypothetical protein
MNILQDNKKVITICDNLEQADKIYELIKDYEAKEDE